MGASRLILNVFKIQLTSAFKRGILDTVSGWCRGCARFWVSPALMIIGVGGGPITRESDSLKVFFVVFGGFA